MRRPILMPLLVAGLGVFVQAQAAGADSLKRGKMLFLQCRACHETTKEASPRIGPTLHGLIGAKAAAVPGFNYSAALRNSKLTWDRATLDQWLANPAKLVPGNTMAFAGMPRPEDRAALIDWLEAETAVRK